MKNQQIKLQSKNLPSKNQLKNLKLVGKIVQHRKNEELGLVLEKSKTHDDYYLILVSGHKLEWHISNIDKK